MGKLKRDVTKVLMLQTGFAEALQSDLQKHCSDVKLKMSNATIVSKCCILVQHMFTETEKKGLFVNDFIELPALKVKGMLGMDYRKIMNLLINLKILQPWYNLRPDGTLIESYWADADKNKSWCKHFRLNPKYMVTPDFTPVEYNVEVSHEQIAQNEVFELNDIEYSKDVYFNWLLSLKRDYATLIQLVDKVIERKLKRDNFNVDAEITQEFIPDISDKVNNRKYNITLQHAFEKAKKLGVNVIQDNDKFYLMDFELFMKWKEDNLKMFHYKSVAKLCSNDRRHFHINRNKRNTRLDHNLTGVAKEVVEELKRVNDLVEIDACNSQYAILAGKVLKATKAIDAKIFAQQASTGNLYVYIAQQLNMKIEEVKVGLMQVIFSSYRSHSTFKDELKKMFPSVLSFCDERKKEFRTAGKDEAEFVVELQTEEANLFLDKILFNIWDKNVPAITRHDSVLCKRQDAEEVLKAIFKSVSAIGHKCAFKTDYKKVIMIDELKEVQVKECPVILPTIDLEYLASLPQHPTELSDEQLNIKPLDWYIQKARSNSIFYSEGQAKMDYFKAKNAIANKIKDIRMAKRKQLQVA